MASVGRNDDGRMGIGTNISMTDKPIFISDDTIPSFSDISAGLNHSAFLSNAGMVYTCGYVMFTFLFV